MARELVLSEGGTGSSLWDLGSCWDREGVADLGEHHRKALRDDVVVIVRRYRTSRRIAGAGKDLRVVVGGEGGRRANPALTGHLQDTGQGPSARMKIACS